MSLLKPRSLFAVEDDGLIQRLDFSDDDEELKNDEDLDSSAEFTSSSPKAPSPIHRSHPNDRSFSSPSEDERMNSSSDSLMSSTMLKPLLKKRLNEQTGKPRVDTTPPYRKVRALRLFGSPQSPKTLLKQSELSTVEAGRRIVPRIVVQKSGDDVSHNGSMQKSRPMFAMYRSSPKLETNINPFYQQDMFQGSQCKRRRDSGICG